MLRRSLVASVLALLVGCQDYNFNPVGKCVIQPGSSRIRVANLSTADILFVVDDSGSMQSKQQRLADNFSAFIDQLALTQKDRADKKLDPLEFHIAVTTSSVYEGNQAQNASCRSTGGGPLTCDVGFPSFGWTDPYSYACTTAGAACGEVVGSYHFTSQCIPGVAADKTQYPAGNFVAAGGNPKVLHFTKDLNWASWNTAAVDPKLDTLVQQFRSNINVGTCGSGMEQHLEAGRLAIQKALRQGGLSQVAGVDPSEWPHAGAKLVVVWVGDEDDCSSPDDRLQGLFFSGGLQNPGADVCTADEALPPAQRKMFPATAEEATLQGKALQSYSEYFSGLGRAFGAAFIYSADPTSCQTDAAGNVTCTPAKCSCTGSGDPSCGGFASGLRFNELSAALRKNGASTLEASVCDADFANALKGIAELVKPPAGLTLPSQPAASEVAVLRIETADGKSSRQCSGPLASGGDQSQADWWFVDCDGKSSAPVFEPTACIFINHATGKCEPNPGETYIAQYLGLVPSGGCSDVAACTRALGGKDSDWTCTKNTAAAAVGTCICNPGT
jgi:hypothetical protein